MTWSVITGDAVGQMRGIAAQSVDAVIADPPYGDTSLPWDSPVDGWLPQVARILKPSGSLWCFGSMRFLLRQATALGGLKLAQDIVWEKHNGSSCANDRFRRVHEHAIHMYQGRWSDVYHQAQYTMDAKARRVSRSQPPPHWGKMGGASYESKDGGPRLMRSVVKVCSCHHGAIHPTQKPEGIIAPLVRYSCPPGGIVVDPFSGSGTTGVVCVREGRRFIGIELDPLMAEKSRDRIAATVAAGTQQGIA